MAGNSTSGRPREAREVVDVMLAMVGAGASDAEIGKAVGKSSEAVSAMLCRLRRRGENVPVRAPKPPPIRRRVAPRLPFDRRPQAEKPPPIDAVRDAPGVRFACVSIQDLPPEQEPRGCRWIEGRLSTGAWRYCQAKARDSSSWCDAHYVRVFRVGPEEGLVAA